MTTITTSNTYVTGQYRPLDTSTTTNAWHVWHTNTAPTVGYVASALATPLELKAPEPAVDRRKIFSKEEQVILDQLYPGGM